MSLNHISSETLWWTKQQQQQSSSPNSAFWPETTSRSNMFAFNLNNMSNSTINEDDDEQIGQAEDNLEEIPREHLFEKPLTPSDVGKLNRLVIPKQHAEKYFPLSGGNGNNNNNNNEANTEKGLLLSFEDELGKSWRFRYSYWNSSQSYVMTKGWSRFVKEKKLDAGDIVSFQRGAGELSKHRLFIDWRRRPIDIMSNHFMVPHHFSDPRIFPLQPNYPTYSYNNNNFTAQQQPPNYYNPHSCYMYGISNSPYYMMGNGNFNDNSTAAATVLSANPLNNLMMRSTAPQGCTSHVVEPRVFDSVPVVQGKVAAKRFRLFGVNMDCPMDHPDISAVPTTTTTTYSHFNSNPIPSEESSEKGKSLDLDI